MIAKEEILKKVKCLPSLPSAVARLSALLEDPMAGAEEFEEVIRPDPALTTNLLRFANSAFFGFRCEVTSVRHAITVLGLRRVFEVASSASFARVLPDRIPGYEIDSLAFWKHSVAVAVLSEQLAKELDLEAPDLIFTAGLLHDIGKLAVGTFLMGDPQRLRTILEVSETALVEAEKVVIGFDHAEVGELVGEDWDMPRAIIVAAGMHHRPSEVADEEFLPLVDLVHVADGLAHSLGYGADIGELTRRIEADSLDRLHVRIDRLEQTACRTLDQIHELSGMLAEAAREEA